MAEALLTDASALAGITPVTLWDDRLEPPGCEGLEWVATRTPQEAEARFLELLIASDRTLIVAPECDGILESLLKMAHAAVGSERVIGASTEAAARCGDKLSLAADLSRWGIPTPKTEALATANLEPVARPCVVKPRYGAGCEETYRLHAGESVSAVPRSQTEKIVQPFVTGIPLSNAVIFGAGGRIDALLPLGRQDIEGHRQLRYAGGEIPWRSEDAERAARLAEDRCHRIASKLPGLRGWIGFDWIWIADEGCLWLIEINPRLTTSYVGYRNYLGVELTRILLDAKAGATLRPVSSGVRFSPSGAIQPPAGACRIETGSSL